MGWGIIFFFFVRFPVWIWINEMRICQDIMSDDWDYTNTGLVGIKDE